MLVLGCWGCVNWPRGSNPAGVRHPVLLNDLLGEGVVGIA
jgi:hypothetical protein